MIEHSWLGIRGSDVTSQLARERGLAVTNGVLIAGALAGSPAAQADVRADDVIVSVAGKSINSMEELGDVLDLAHAPGETITLGIARGRQRVDIPLTLGKWPERIPPSS
jgi:S1-C subfamily serine protease